MNNRLIHFVVCLGLVSSLSMPSMARNVEVRPLTDSTTVLRNPLSGWVMYLARTWDENFWEERGYDHISMPGGRTAKVSDYASTAYVRTSWASLEPEEGKYAWTDPDSRLNRLLSSCQQRGMRIALRIVVDARDQGQNTPLFVKDAGAEGFYTKIGNKECFTPYADDPVFQQKYSNFIHALAERFNDPDEMDFIDAYGLGKWGEGHAVVYKDNKNKIPTFDWITSLYVGTFTKTPLLMHYHRVIGDPNQNSYGEVSPDTEGMLKSCYDKGYSLRHDAFGMTDYYQQWEKDYAARYKFVRPIILEGGWITGAHHRYWIDSSHRYRQDHPEDVRHGEYVDAAEAHVNMMDLRAGNETYSWFAAVDTTRNDNTSLVESFVREGSYRLHPAVVKYNNSVKAGKKVSITHTWDNMGWGYCPTNIPQWHQRYKVAFALMNEDGEISNVVVDNQTDLSKWIKGAPVTYQFDYPVDKKGTYKLLTGLVYTDEGNKIGIQVAVDQSLKTKEGWVILGDIKIK